MPLKKSHGNMYDWVTHMHSHLGGECPHKCVYCYVQKNRFGVSPRYQGAPRLIEEELKVDYGSGKVIFIEHMNDMFANEIPLPWQTRILWHCRSFPENKYIFQTKNPQSAYYLNHLFPNDFMIGTTLETDLSITNISQAPSPFSRYLGLKKWQLEGVSIFITIEPILDFDVNELSDWIIGISPAFVNIGADSKGCRLPEPSKEKVLELINILQKNNIIIKKKVNLRRLGIDVNSKKTGEG